MNDLTLFAPSGRVPDRAGLRKATQRLRDYGFEVQLHPLATALHQRFAGTDEQRLAALHEVAQKAPSVALAVRGGYGLSRLMTQIDWSLLAKAVARGTRWVGYSDITALHLGLYAQTRAPSWAGPTALSAFAGETVDEVTRDCFLEAMSGELEAIGFRTQERDLDGLEAKGTLWGGNLSMVCALLGTPYLPKVKKGLLFLEDVNEHPYRVERMLLQLLQAGVIDAQSAVLLGDFAPPAPNALDKGYRLKDAVAALRSRTRTPIVTGLPFGHIRTHVSLPVGTKASLLVEQREALVVWG